MLFLGLNLEVFQRYASYDGDADRIVYYTLNNDGKFVLLDGDKIASLYILYIKELLDQVCVIFMIQSVFYYHKFTGITFAINFSKQIQLFLVKLAVVRFD